MASFAIFCGGGLSSCQAALHLAKWIQRCHKSIIPHPFGFQNSFDVQDQWVLHVLGMEGGVVALIVQTPAVEAGQAHINALRQILIE